MVYHEELRKKDNHEINLAVIEKLNLTEYCIGLLGSDTVYSDGEKLIPFNPTTDMKEAFKILKDHKISISWLIDGTCMVIGDTRNHEDYDYPIITTYPENMCRAICEVFLMMKEENYD